MESLTSALKPLTMYWSYSSEKQNTGSFKKNLSDDAH